MNHCPIGFDYPAIPAGGQRFGGARGLRISEVVPAGSAKMRRLRGTGLVQQRRYI